MDLQLSKDGHLIVQHDATLNVSTNIAEYAGFFDSEQRSDGNWYVEDFNLA